MAGFLYVSGDPENWLYDWWVLRGIQIMYGEGAVLRFQDNAGRIDVFVLDPPVETMARLMDEIEAFEESLKPKPEPIEEDIPLSAEQFIADGWERTAGYNFYRQNMHACWVENDRTWRLLVGNDDTLHTSMKSLKARIRELLDQKFQWLL